MSRIMLLTIGLVCALAVADAQAIPGDEFWADDFYRVGLTGEVLSFADYDGRLVIGGTLTFAGNVPVRALATWDGAQWAEFAGGVDGELTSLLVLGDDLIVAGEFTTAGEVAAQNIARWDGTAWHPLGGGSGGRIENLVVYDGQLVALGDFSAVAGPGAARIAAWDGTSWQALGAGPQVPGLGTLYANTVYGDALIVGGATAGYPQINGLAVWDGAAWSAPYPFPGNYPEGGVYWGEIRSLSAYQGDLVAGGTFWHYGDGDDDFTGIARWDGGQWVGLDHGLKAPTQIESDAHSIRSLRVWNGDLLVSGEFWMIEDWNDCGGIARWDGAAWHAMDFGVADYWLVGQGTCVFATTIWQGQLFIGGRFFLAGSDQDDESRNIARWGAQGWEEVGPWGWGLENDVRALADFGGAVVAGDQQLTADGWSTLGAGISGSVWALMPFDGELVAGGSFTNADHLPALNVAAWNGAVWRPLGAGVPAAVHALAEYDGELFAGAYRWDGAAWVNTLQTNGPVYALLVWNGDLYAAGAFSTAHGVAAAGIVRWDGTACHALGAGLTHRTLHTPMDGYALADYQGDLVVGGNFYQAGDVWATHLARWDGSDWYAIDGLGSWWSEYGVYSLTSFGSQLFVGGRIVGQETDINFLGRFDGATWHTLGSGMEGSSGSINVRALLIADGNLWVGGAFALAGGKPAANVSRWRDPDILTTPSAVDAPPAVTARLAAVPNPFNPTTTITFTLPVARYATLAVYDLAGRRVVTLAEGVLAAGRSAVAWDGCDAAGRAMPSGPYIARLHHGADVLVSKLMLVR